MQALRNSLQTLVLTHSEPHMKVALSEMKELRILICDGTVNLISIPQNLLCLRYANKDFSIEGPFGQTILGVPKNNQLAFMNRLDVERTYGFWKSFERKTLSFFNGKAISGFTAKHYNLRYLDLVGCDSLRSCPGVGDLFALEQLSFDYCTELKELPNLQQLTRLRKLNICSCASIVAVPGLGNLVALEELSFDCCSNLKELPNLQQLTRLRKLNINNCYSIVAVPGLGNLVALVEFEALSCHSLVALPNMHKLTNLQRLDLSFSYSLKGVSGVSELIALQTLRIEHQALQGGFNLHKLNKLVTLRVWDWRGPPTFSDVVSLEVLEIWDSGEGIEMMPNLLNLARLQRVHIGNCKFKDVSCLGNLISLRSLSISECDSLETLPDMHKLTRLEELEVGSCPNNVVWARVSISKSSDTLWINQPRIGNGMALHTFRLGEVGCRELPDLSLFPKLKELTIWNCRRLERLISTMPMTALERLRIARCDELQEVPDLSQCQLLCHCRIQSCGKISLTMDDIMKLEAMCPGLKIVFGS